MSALLNPTDAICTKTHFAQVSSYELYQCFNTLWSYPVNGLLGFLTLLMSNCISAIILFDTLWYSKILYKWSAGTPAVGAVPWKGDLLEHLSSGPTQFWHHDHNDYYHHNFDTISIIITIIITWTGRANLPPTGPRWFVVIYNSTQPHSFRQSYSLYIWIIENFLKAVLKEMLIMMLMMTMMIMMTMCKKGPRSAILASVVFSHISGDVRENHFVRVLHFWYSYLWS